MEPRNSFYTGVTNEGFIPSDNSTRPQSQCLSLGTKDNKSINSNFNFRAAPFRNHTYAQVDALTPKRESQQVTSSDTYSEIPHLSIQSQGQADEGQSFMNNQENEDKQMEDEDEDDISRTSKHGYSKAFLIMQLLSGLFIVWDAAQDWLIVQKFDDDACAASIIDEGHFSKFDICDYKREGIRQVLAGFTIFGTAFSFIQIINTITHILESTGLSKFHLFRCQTEVYISIFLEEVPQALILLVFNYNCSCQKTIKLYSILAILSGFLSSALRYVASYAKYGGPNGCCNAWWRCCCCRNKKYLCHITIKDCLCKWDIPCPFCCFTLQYKQCRCTTHMWMCKTLFSRSRQAKASYGIRVLVNIGLLFLFSCLLANIVLLGMSGLDYY